MNALILFLYSETIVCAVRPVCLFNNLTRILPWDLESFFNSFENNSEYFPTAETKFELIHLFTVILSFLFKLGS